jgi:hypothetical protein
MLHDGIIAPSNSPWNFSILVVAKKAGAWGKIKWRIVVVFRNLNDVTIDDSFSTLVISEFHDALDNSKYFSMIDYMSGFLHIPIKLKDKKIGFSTREGHFQYKEWCMPLQHSRD